MTIAGRGAGANPADGERNRRQSIIGKIRDTWKHEPLPGRVRVSLEEAYMIKKQQSLNLHFIPCAKIMHWFNKVTANRDAKVINTKEFYTILRAINLLKADCSMTDERW